MCGWPGCAALCCWLIVASSFRAREFLNGVCMLLLLLLLFRVLSFVCLLASLRFQF